MWAFLVLPLALGAPEGQEDQKAKEKAQHMEWAKNGNLAKIPIPDGLLKGNPKSASSKASASLAPPKLEPFGEKAEPFPVKYPDTLPGVPAQLTNPFGSEKPPSSWGSAHTSFISANQANYLLPNATVGDLWSCNWDSPKKNMYPAHVIDPPQWGPDPMQGSALVLFNNEMPTICPAGSAKMHLFYNPRKECTYVPPCPKKEDGEEQTYTLAELPLDKMVKSFMEGCFNLPDEKMWLVRGECTIKAGPCQVTKKQPCNFFRESASSQ